MSTFKALQDAVKKAERSLADIPCPCGEYDPNCTEQNARCVIAHTELKAAREILEETFRMLKEDPNAPIPAVGAAAKR